LQILCEGPSKTNPARLTGRTRTNKVAVFEGNGDEAGQLLDLKIFHSTGFSLTGKKAASGDCDFDTIAKGAGAAETFL
jgi:tRNA-2-methylthio-N6-dimethylallyladenosine synthase